MPAGAAIRGRPTPESVGTSLKSTFDIDGGREPFWPRAAPRTDWSREFVGAAGHRPQDGTERARPRVGHISFLNCVPLLWGLAKSGALSDVDLTEASPDILNTALAEGRLDMGPISVFEYLKHSEDLVALSDVAVGSDGDVQSCLLFSKVPPAGLDGARVALGSTSRTSVRLAQLLLAERVGVRPEYHVAPPDLTRMLEDAEAAVVIGDAALRAALHDAPRLGLHVHDLGGMWREWTGLPFVFAVFAARREFLARRPDAVRRVHTSLIEARDLSLQEIDLICEQIAERAEFDAERLKDYYLRGLRFDFGARELAALTEFARRVGGPGAGFPPDVRIDVIPAP